MGRKPCDKWLFSDNKTFSENRENGETRGNNSKVSDGKGNFSLPQSTKIDYVLNNNYTHILQNGQSNNLSELWEIPNYY